MTHLLDTNILSDARRRRSTSLMHWLEEQEIGTLFLSVVSVLELERGVRRKERVDPVGAEPLRRWLDEDVKPMFVGRILPIGVAPCPGPEAGDGCSHRCDRDRS